LKSGSQIVDYLRLVTFASFDCLIYFFPINIRRPVLGKVFYFGMGKLEDVTQLVTERGVDYAFDRFQLFGAGYSRFNYGQYFTLQKLDL